jgi:2-polyprenyl-3-methyl-5-hydroxy-6-metoxy-1,4-benzoquinol methylase
MHQSYIICPLCNSNDEKQIIHNKLRYEHPGLVYKCLTCDYIFLFPRLADKEQDLYYQTKYRQDYQDNPVSQRFITDTNEALQRIFRICQNKKNPHSILEIGSGSGAFLNIATNYFARAVGVEVDQDSYQFINNKGLKIFNNLDLISQEKFDFIVLFHVLEHLLDPIGFLSKLRLMLNDNGKIIIEVPNVDDSLISIYDIKEFKDFYFCSAHVSYFSAKTLKYCLEQSKINNQISFVQRYDVYNHINWLKNKQPGDLETSLKIFSEKMCKAYSADLINNSVADTLWAVGYAN